MVVGDLNSQIMPWRRASLGISRMLPVFRTNILGLTPSKVSLFLARVLVVAASFVRPGFWEPLFSLGLSFLCLVGSVSS